MQNGKRDNGKGTLIIGAGLSGLALARLLCSRGLPVILADASKPQTDLPEDLQRLPYRHGPFRDEWLEGIDCLALSPGVPPTVPAAVAARKAGIRVSGEVEEAFRLAGAPVIAITGTNGKSTTTTLISLFLEAQGFNAPAGGNLGRPFSELVEQEPAADFYVVEISSFQCETFATFRPYCAGLLNLTPDHLDRYHDLEDYFRTKLRLFERMGAGDHLFLPADDDIAGRLESCPASRYAFSLESPVTSGAWLADAALHYRHDERSETILPVAEIRLVGRHNVANALAAIAATIPCGVGPAAIAQVLRSFPGLPHRMEDLGELHGIRCYNDSKATNVEATLASLGGLTEPLLLIAGGKDKGGDFELMARELPQVRRLYGIGEAGPDIVRAFGARGVVKGEMKTALDAALEEGRAGELLILSPACASYDQYRNFEKRGDHLRNLIEEMQC
ncbi:MAG: UDP-N-acetylmuramoyl-L-alanine--D-glutamate ligase [bacterium]|nr:UDP-N-acetylmuramoyl-L-alanine--D-glutamate ligase [bacterium]